MTFDLDIWHPGSPWQVDTILFEGQGQCSRSQEEIMLLSGRCDLKWGHSSIAMQINHDQTAPKIFIAVTFFQNNWKIGLLQCITINIRLSLLLTWNMTIAWNMTIILVTRMWADAQRDGRTAEYRWRPLFNAAKFGWRPLLEYRAVTLPRREPVRICRGAPNSLTDLSR